MIAATVLAVFFVPVFYVVIQGLIEYCRPMTSSPAINTSAPQNADVELDASIAR